jgi:threonine/homoserine/homoserine lactone efflux protein
MAAALGALTGLCVHMLLAAAGLSVLIARSPGALTTIRWVGAAYLMWLGINLIRSSLRNTENVQGSDVPISKAYTHAMLTNLLNPKAILFFAAVIPQFIVPGASTTLQIVALGLADVATGVLFYALLVTVGTGISAWFSKPEVRRRWDRVTGGALTCLGVTLATTKL